MTLYLAWLLLIGGSLISPSSGLERFFVDQCECISGSLESVFTASVSQSTDTGTFTVNNPAGFDCIAAERGIVRDLNVDQISSISGVLDQSFFNDAGSRTMWYAVFDFDLGNAIGNGGQTFQVARLTFPTTAVTLEVTTDLVGAQNDIPVATIRLFSDFFDFSTANRAINEVNRISFGEFKGEDAYGGNIFGFYACYQFNNGADNIECSQVTSTADILGAVNANVPVTIAFDDDGTLDGSYKLEHFAFEQSTDLEILTTVDPATATNLANAIDLDDPPLPIFLNQPIPAEEDVDLTDVNILGLLSSTELVIDITIADPLVVTGFGTLSGFNGTHFALFDPVDDAFGDAVFSFSYTSASQQVSYECTLDVNNAVVDIAGVEDAPTLIAVGDLESVAFVEKNFNETVAVSVDFPDNQGNAGTLLTGFVRVVTGPTGGDLFEEDCVSPILENDPVGTPLDAQGNFRFCYRGNQGNIAGLSDSFTYTVRPGSNNIENQAAGQGTITLLGGNPVNPNDNVVKRSRAFIEGGVDQVLPVIAGNDPENLPDGAFAVLDESLSSFDFEIEIVTLPDAAVGSLSTQDGPVQVGDKIAVDQNLLFTAGDNFFNANSGGTQNNDAGVNIFGVGCAEAEKVGGVCPDTSFTYRVLFGDPVVPSAVTNFGIIVAAVDDGGAVFEQQQEEPLLANSNDARNGFITVSGAGLQVTSDNGGNVFNIGVRFEGIAGVLVRLPIRVQGDPIGTRIENGVVSAQDCISAGCEVMHLIGTPGQLNAFLDEVEYEVPVEEQGGPPRVDVFLASGVAAAQLRENVALYAQQTPDPSEITFDVQAIDEGFFDDVQNVAIVAGSAGGVLLIVLIVVIVKATTVNSVNGEKVKRLSETGPKKFKQRGGVAASKQPKRKRSFEEDDEDEENPPPKSSGKGDPLLDWEKHIDPKTKQPFYHNTRTKETVWELPEGL